MGDWLHCNTCFKQPGDGRPYYLTGCGHIFCEVCKSKGWKERCMMCSTPNPSALKLTSKLLPPVDTYFSDPIKLMKQIATELKQLIAAAEFQHHQRKKFVAQLQKMEAIQKTKVHKQEQELKARMASHYEQFEKENCKLREENRYLKKLLIENPQSLRSACGDRLPAQKGYGSPCYFPNTSKQQSFMNSAVSPNAMTLVTSGRISVRTPPSQGKMGTIQCGTTPEQEYVRKSSPMSVPHPISFHSMETTP